MSDLISRQALYEKTAEWEARALAVIEKMNRKPFEEMDANEITEWRKWSCILGERSAFKHDVADAPSVQTEIIRCKDCYYCVAEKSYGETYYYCDAFSYHAEGDLIGVSLQVSPEHFCGWAERRTDE